MAKRKTTLAPPVKPVLTPIDLPEDFQKGLVEILKEESKELPKELEILEEPEPILYTSKILMTNPFTQDTFQPGVPTEATLDSWLESQISAGLITCQ